MKRVAIIGSGSSGLIALKVLLEDKDQFQCDVFEKSSAIGGLWNYREDNEDQELASIMKSLVMNTSKEMTSFSSFPVPEDFPNYMHNKKMFEYLELFCETFSLKKFIKFNHHVLQCLQTENTWSLKVKNLLTNHVTNTCYDCVLVCAGLNNFPKHVTFEDQHVFKGKVMHARDYKHVAREELEGKHVAVIGIGNSGVDIAVEMSHVAEQVYLSTRTGSWIAKRVGLKGLPFDSQFHRKSLKSVLKVVPKNFFGEKLIEMKNFDHKLYNLRPKHRIFSQHPTVNDELANRILSGSIMVKQDIEKFTERGIIFKNCKQEHQCDLVVMATGYKLHFPFLPNLSLDKNNFNLFKHVFSPELAHAHTLGILACVQPNGAVPPLVELQARWFKRLNCAEAEVILPTRDRMWKEIEKRKRKVKKEHAFNVERHALQEDWMEYCDDLAREIGCKPNLSRYFFTDFKLWWKLFFGPSLPFQYRLQGPNSNPKEAKKLIFSSNKRTKFPLNTRK